MNAAIRWRIIVLQVVAIFVLAIGTVGAYAAYSFTNAQIHDQLAPQQISFPKDAAAGLPDNLKAVRGPAGPHRRPGARLRREVHRAASE